MFHGVVGSEPDKGLDYIIALLWNNAEWAWGISACDKTPGQEGWKEGTSCAQKEIYTWHVFIKVQINHEKCA